MANSEGGGEALTDTEGPADLSHESSDNENPSLGNKRGTNDLPDSPHIYQHS